MNKNNKDIPIFFAVDDGYIPFLAVSLESLISNSSKEYNYVIRILYTKISGVNQQKIKQYERENVSIEFVDLSEFIERIKDKLYTRDYYSKTTYFRLFIPELYPQYNKALYLDSDIVILSDIANLYNEDVGDNLVAAVPDEVIQNIEVFQVYAEKVVGVADYRNYFNAGILLMNLEELRKFKFQEKFLYSLEKIKFSVAQDQDYLNRLCKGRVKLLDTGWNVMPISDKKIKEEDLKLIHYNLAYKPWHFENIPYQEYFWEYARKTEFINRIMEIKSNYTEQDVKKDEEQYQKLKDLAQRESDCVGDDRKYRRDIKVKENPVKVQDRLEILEKIKNLEKEGKFDIDPEKDPPTIVLTSDNVDYLKEKSTSKLKAKFANKIGEKFLEKIVKEKRLIIKEINGIENLNKVKTGAIITCNHFNPFDSFTVESVFRMSTQPKNKKLYKVIREGNYTNFPGFYGFLFRNCDTLPLSSSTETMVEFMKAVDKILQRGDFILIYPEQSLWWNYRKPKPLKNGAFRMAVRNNVPVIPIFITMQDTDNIGEDGFPIQEYIVNINEPIYQDDRLTKKENEAIMKEKNFETWKNVYEEFYKIPLEYITEKKVAN